MAAAAPAGRAGGEHWLIETGPESEPGINGGLGKGQSDDRVLNTIDVKDIDWTLKEVKAQGGTIIGEKGPIPGIGWFAQFRVLQGNVMGLMQADPTAK